MDTYLFYDIETTGLNYAFDQVLQFAAIRADAAFNEIERHEIIVKLRPDVIPSPSAMIAHCIPISKSMSRMCEFEATQKIHALLNEPNTISLGYNTLRFDDEFLRFAFYRNLLPPYRHQFANNCRRMDLLPMVTIFWPPARKGFRPPRSAHHGIPCGMVELMITSPNRNHQIDQNNIKAVNGPPQNL